MIVDEAARMMIAPLFVHVLLLTFVGVNTVVRRYRSAMRGEAQLRKLAVDAGAWPDHVRKWSNNYDNQFQLPVMWYALTAIVLALGMADRVFGTLSWLFVVLRIAHMVIHTGRNVVLVRLAVFLAGYATLLAMWVWLGLRVFVNG